MVLITLAVAIYKKHQDAKEKNEEIKELAHDGNFTLPEKVPSIPATAESGQHWRIGVDPAAKGALHHDSDMQIISDARNSTDSGSGESDASEVDELWDEVASLVGCETPRQSDYGFARMGSVGEKRLVGIKRGGSKMSYRSSLQRSMTGKMSVMSTDSWTSRYSCATDGRRYDDDEDDYDESEGLNLRY